MDETWTQAQKNQPLIRLVSESNCAQTSLRQLWNTQTLAWVDFVWAA